jgi:hypothetical protein
MEGSTSRANFFTLVRPIDFIGKNLIRCTVECAAIYCRVKKFDSFLPVNPSGTPAEQAKSSTDEHCTYLPNFSIETGCLVNSR